MAWCDNSSPASVWHPDIPQYRTQHQFIPVRTSESRHSNHKIASWENNESLYILCISHSIPEGSSISHFCIVLSEIHKIPSYHKSRTSYSIKTWYNTYLATW